MVVVTEDSSFTPQGVTAPGLPVRGPAAGRTTDIRVECSESAGAASAAFFCGRKGPQLYTSRCIFVARVTSRAKTTNVSYRMDFAIAPYPASHRRSGIRGFQGRYL